MDTDIIITFTQGADKLGDIRIKTTQDGHTMTINTDRGTLLADAMETFYNLVNRLSDAVVRPATIPVE